MLQAPAKKLANINKIDDKLNEIYENQITIASQTNYIDRSEVLLEQMNFIALNNRSFINYKYN